MGAPVFHAAWCRWRTGGECGCGGNRNAEPNPENCQVCADVPCSCARFADADAQP